MFATNSLLELGGDERDNLNLENFKIDSFKIRKISTILGNFKIRKIRILNLCLIRFGPQHIITKRSNNSR